MGTWRHEPHVINNGHEPHFINNSHTFRVRHLGDGGGGDMGTLGHGDKEGGGYMGTLGAWGLKALQRPLGTSGSFHLCRNNLEEGFLSAQAFEACDLLTDAFSGTEKSIL